VSGLYQSGDALRPSREHPIEAGENPRVTAWNGSRTLMFGVAEMAVVVTLSLSLSVSEHRSMAIEQLHDEHTKIKVTSTQGLRQIR
jgi:hypothetical protein